MQQTKKYDFLDGLRGVAICFVLLSHIHYTGFETGSFFNIGLIGVPLFFMISAYTLALSQDKKGTYPGRLKQFFTRRLCRIYPLYFLLTVISFILGYSGISTNRHNFNEGIFSFSNLFTHLTFTNGFFQSFMNSFRLGERSLFSEIFFYGIFPLLFPLIRNSFKNNILLILIALGIYSLRNIGATAGGLDSTYIYHFPLYHLIDFTLGFLLFHLHKKYFQSNREKKRSYMISSGIRAIFLGLLIAYSQGFYINHILWLISLFALSIGAMLSLPLLQWIKLPIFCYIGKISYSLYLWNLLVLCAVGYYSPFGNPVYNLLLAIILLIAIGTISYKYEEYGISLGRRFSS